MEKQNLEIQSVNPKTLSSSELRSINEVTQDMWAHGIGEFVQCEDCGEMHSKDDIFWWFPQELYKKTVAEILRELDIKTVQCPSCNGKTRFIYGEENIENIRERFFESESFLVVCRDQSNQIVGYMDGYIDTLDIIYKREFYYHYDQIGLPEIHKRVQNVLGLVPAKSLCISSMWLTQKYSSLFSIFQMMQWFYASIPDNYQDTPWIAELDSNNNLYKIYNFMGMFSLKIRECLEFREKITNTWKNYASDIVIFQSPVREFNARFSMWIKDFIKMYRGHVRMEHSSISQLSH